MKKYPEYKSVLDSNLLIARLSILNICTFSAINFKTIRDLQSGVFGKL